jgi:TolB-like protein/class 3 adenylate cyclase/Tfp pilus assembly protein PilF
MGTVTFLFTDIEGSTELWETQRRSMGSALARHDALLRQCIEEHSGHVVKTLGDGFHAAFATAPDALEAALATQHALHSEPWPESVRIRVRMALHSGVAELRDGDYYGPTLNRVARLLTIGHGGQTLLSEATQELCRDLLPPGALLKRLGEYYLKGLARRESVFQLCHPALQQVFPPLKTPLALIDGDTPSIAVLPFRDLSAQKDQDYFADGLAEELLNVLSKIRGIRVASRTSAFSFKDMKVDIPTVAQKLNVATILEGSVRKAGNRVRITAQLVQVATDSHLWSETYDRALEDIFAVQDDIAQAVVKELRNALLGREEDPSGDTRVQKEVAAALRGRSDNTEAYERYLHGLFFVDRWTREDEAKAAAYFRQAVELDPEYALAWAGLSGAYAYEATNNWTPVAVGFEQARRAAERALELEPDLAEGHEALAWIRMYYDWDWKGADASFRRALELAPGNAEVMRGAAILAANLGRQQEAIGILRQVVAHDPLSVATHRYLGREYFRVGLLDEAEVALKKALELHPQSGFAHFWLGLVHLAQGRLAEAVAAMRLEGQDAFRLQGLALVQHAQRHAAESDATLHELIDKYAQVQPYLIAVAYAYCGEVDGAFEWLERAYAQHDPGLTQVKPQPLLRNLHADPRWQPFLDKMGLAD